MLFELFNFFMVLLILPWLSIVHSFVVLFLYVLFFSFDAFVWMCCLFGLFFLQQWKWTWTNIAMLWGGLKRALNKTKKEKKNNLESFVVHTKTIMIICITSAPTPLFLSLSFVLFSSHLIVVRFTGSIRRTGNNISLLMVCFLSRLLTSYCLGLGSCSA